MHADPNDAQRHLLLVERACAWFYLEEGITALLGAMTSLSRDTLNAPASEQRPIASPVGAMGYCHYCYEVVMPLRAFCSPDCRDGWEREQEHKTRSGNLNSPDPEDLAEATGQLRQIWAAGEEETLFEEYLHRLVLQRELTEDDVLDLRHKFCAAVAENTQANFPPMLKKSSDAAAASALAIFRAFPKQTELDAQILGPLLYLRDAAFQPLNSCTAIPALVRKMVAELGRPSLLQVDHELRREGINCRPDYLRAICMSDPQLLLCVSSGVHCVALSAGLLPRFRLAAFNLEEESYCELRKIRVAIPDEEGFQEFCHVRIDPQPLIDFHTEHGFTEEACNVDWFEVAAKSAILHRESPQVLVQDLEPHLHVAIVDELIKSQRAMSLKELQAALGFWFRLAPDGLGPGRIMAYARNPRFLEPDSAFYVLAEWVETDTEKKNRIARDRIVTPFREKSWVFDVNDLPSLCYSDPLAREFSILQPKRLAEQIAFKLPDKPIEPYYVRRIGKLLRATLDKHAINVGGDSYILPSEFNFDIKRGGRKEILRAAIAERLGVDDADLTDRLLDCALAAVKDQTIAADVRKLLAAEFSTDF